MISVRTMLKRWQTRISSFNEKSSKQYTFLKNIYIQYLHSPELYKTWRSSCGWRISLHRLGINFYLISHVSPRSDNTGGSKTFPNSDVQDTPWFGAAETECAVSQTLPYPLLFYLIMPICKCWAPSAKTHTDTIMNQLQKECNIACNRH